MTNERVVREDRHLRLAEKVTGKKTAEIATKFLSRVLVTGDEGWLTTPAGRLTALTAVNLIARFCPKIDIEFGGATSLQQEILDLARRIDRRTVADFRAGSEVAGADYAAVLYLGRPVRLTSNMTSVVGEGWLAAVSSDGPAPQPPAAGYNPFGPILAACLGAAEVFKRLLHADPNKVAFFEPSAFSAYSYQVWSAAEMPEPGPALPEVIDLPVTLLAGAGAVGNAFAYALREVQGLRGRLAVVDKEIVEDETNLNRYSLAFHDDACGPVRTRKVDLVNRAFQAAGIRCTPHREEIDAYLARIHDGAEPWPGAVISAVDNNEIRPSLQRLLPDILIEGATSDSLFQVSRHVYEAGLACLMCIHTANGVASTERPYAELIADRSGLSQTRVRAALGDAELVVTEADVMGAPKEKRSFLREQLGQRICSVLSELAKLSTEPENVPQAATVSFVSMAAGTLAAAELVKWAADLSSALETMYNMDMFVSLENAMLLPWEKVTSCECHVRREANEKYRVKVIKWIGEAAGG